MRHPHVFLETGLRVKFLAAVFPHDLLLLPIGLGLMPRQLFLTLELHAAT
ncbi:MAG TPA: hypothetical protein VK201_06675 [bacterium]|nr:hypothetical protein [bacterium]